MAGSATQSPTGGNPAGTRSFSLDTALKPIAAKMQEAGLGAPTGSAPPGQAGGRPPPAGGGGLAPTGRSFQASAGGGGSQEMELRRLLAQLGGR